MTLSSLIKSVCLGSAALSSLCAQERELHWRPLERVSVQNRIQFFKSLESQNFVSPKAAMPVRQTQPARPQLAALAPVGQPQGVDTPLALIQDQGTDALVAKIPLPRKEKEPLQETSSSRVFNVSLRLDTTKSNLEKWISSLFPGTNLSEIKAPATKKRSMYEPSLSKKIDIVLAKAKELLEEPISTPFAPLYKESIPQSPSLSAVQKELINSSQFKTYNAFRSETDDEDATFSDDTVFENVRDVKLDTVESLTKDLEEIEVKINKTEPGQKRRELYGIRQTLKIVLKNVQRQETAETTPIPVLQHIDLGSISFPTKFYENNQELSETDNQEWENEEDSFTLTN